MSQWGASTNNESKPKDKWLEPHLANVFATSRGWVLRRPWGDEVLVGIGGLATLLGVPTHVGVEVVNTLVANTAAANIAFRLLFNEPVVVDNTATLVAISDQLANVSLTYRPALSEPTAGRLVFANTTVNLNTAAAGNGTVAFTVNAASVFSGEYVVDAETANAVSNTLGDFSNTITISEFTPGLTKVWGGAAPANTANVAVSFALDYNAPLTVTGTPTLVAITSNASIHANLTLSYSAADSNTALGNLVFSVTGVDLANATGLVYTVNASSLLVGFDGIADASGNLVQNSIGIKANTVTVS